MPHLYQVGKRYNPNRRSWPEGPQFNYRENTFELVLFFTKPSVGEMYEIAQEQSEFALLPFGDVLFFLSRFGRGPWYDSSYSYHLLPSDQQTPLPELEPGQGILLAVMLVDASTGIIKVIRAVSLSPDFSRKLVAAIKDQLARPFDPAGHDAQIAKAYKLYSESKAMLKDAIARTVGGRE